MPTLSEIEQQMIIGGDIYRINSSGFIYCAASEPGSTTDTLEYDGKSPGSISKDILPKLADSTSGYYYSGTNGQVGGIYNILSKISNIEYAYVETFNGTYSLHTNGSTSGIYVNAGSDVMRISHNHYGYDYRELALSADDMKVFDQMVGLYKADGKDRYFEIVGYNGYLRYYTSGKVDRIKTS